MTVDTVIKHMCGREAGPEVKAPKSFFGGGSFSVCMFIYIFKIFYNDYEVLLQHEKKCNLSLSTP